MLARLRDDPAPVLSVVAPAGSGKTTLLTQWADREPHDVLWITARAQDDPATLAAALGPWRLDGSSGGGSPSSIAAQLGATTAPFTVVIDDVDVLTDAAAIALIAELAHALPAGARIGLGSRAALPFPVPYWRAQGRIAEVTAEDLAMDAEEARQLFLAAGLTPTVDELDALVQATEGWSVALVFAAQASKRAGARAGDATTLRGDDLLIADYLRSEVLAGLPAASRSFLVRTAVLDRLSSGLCEAVAGHPSAQAMLEALDAGGAPLVRLDAYRREYRYSRLFRQFLRAELERIEPHSVAELNRRAARWLAQHGEPAAAIGHAFEAGDQLLVDQLLRAQLPQALARGHLADARSWLGSLRVAHQGTSDRLVAALGAWAEAMSGEPAAAECWAAAATDEIPGVPGRVDAQGEGAVALLEAVRCTDGPARMRDDARSAFELLGPRSPLAPSALLFEALAHLLDGDAEQADPVLAHAHDLAVNNDTMPVAAWCAAARAGIAGRRGDWDRALVLVDRGLDVVRSAAIEDTVEAAAVFAAAARSAVHNRAKPATAARHLVRAARLQHLLSYAVPATALVQVELARAHLELADPPSARSVLRELRDVLHQRPQLGQVVVAAQELADMIEASSLVDASGPLLTTAELRLLPYLSSHLRFREIGLELHVSRNTIKTQAVSVYRKLGVSNRSEAVRRLTELGLA